MKTSKRFVSIVLVLVMLFSLCGVSYAESDLSGQVVIIHTNDVHGAVDGYAKVAALKNDYAARGAYVLLLDAGDFSQGSVYVSGSSGAEAVKLMNMAGYDAATVGNHEFDYGYEQLKSNLEIAEFMPVCANMKYNGKAPLKANAVFTAPDGTKIGVFGVITPETSTKANPSKIKGVTFDKGDALIADAKAQVKALKAAGCKLIVCLGHLGVEESASSMRSTDLIAKVDGINLFIDGHSHTVIDGMSNSYGQGSTMIVSTGSSFEKIGVVTYNAGELSSRLLDVTKDMAADGAVQAAVDGIKAATQEKYGEVFAKSETVLNGERASVRASETNLGDLICDAMVWKAEKEGLDVDAALTNGGGIRASIGAGDITKKDVNTVLPFGNTLFVVKLTGAKLLETLEACCFAVPEPVGAFAQVSGIKYTADIRKPFDAGGEYPGSTYLSPKTIQRVTIESVGGKPFDPDAVYTIATNDFIAAGGDAYHAFASASLNVDTGIIVDEAVMEYISEKLGGTVTAADYGKAKGNIKLIIPVAAIFEDVLPDSWFVDNVQYCYDNGLMLGTSPSTFSPDEEISRTMAATMLYRLAGSPKVSAKASALFTDCKDGEWYSDAVVWAYENKIITGLEAHGAFAPDSALERDILASMIYNTEKYLGGGFTGSWAFLLDYADASEIDDWAYEAICWCKVNGIMIGKENNRFDCDGFADRAAGAAILERLYSRKAA